MTPADKERLLTEIDRALECIELLDDRTPISTKVLREIRYEIVMAKVELDG